MATGASKKEKAPLRKKVQRKGPAIKNAFVLIALIFSTFLVGFWVYKVAAGLEKTGKGLFLLPPLALPDYPYGMFSIAHISEFVNQLLLLSPLGIFLILFFVFFKLKLKDFKDKLINYLIISTLSGLIYLFVFNFTLGSADWDLRSSPAPFIGLLGVLLFLKWGEGSFRAHSSPSAGIPHMMPSDAEPTSSSVDGRTKIWIRKHTLHSWGLIFICFNLFHTVPWILIHVDRPKSVARYVLIQENDPHPVDEINYNLYKIARILEWAGWPEEIPKMYRRATEKNPYDTLSYFNLAAYYHQNRDFDQAFVTIDTLLKIDPLNPRGNWMMGDIYIKRGEHAKALPYLKQALPFFTGHPEPDYFFDLGLAYYNTDRVKEALACGQAMIELVPHRVEGYHLLAVSHAALDNYKDAKKAWDHVISIDPSDSVSIQNLKLLKRHIKR